MSARRAGPGPTTLALLAILVITAAWWALALWPAGSGPPEWLVRTRAACFGAVNGGLPDTGGWILLIGQPLGMLGFLLVVWGGTLRGELPRWGRTGTGRAVLAGAAILLLAGAGLVGRRLTRPDSSAGEPDAGVLTRPNLPLPLTRLVDQLGRVVSLAGRREQPFLLTFAYGHCATVCPTLVRELSLARDEAGRPDLPLLVVTLDPWRDTPERLAWLAEHWGLRDHDLLLSGSVAEVERTLDLLGIGRRRDSVTGDIDHAGTVLLVERGGLTVWRLDGGWWQVKQLLAGGG